MIVQYQNSKCSVSQQIIAFWDVKLKHIPYSISIILCSNFAAMDINNIFWIHMVPDQYFELLKQTLRII